MANSTEQCSMCPNMTPNRCGTCKSSAYCSKSCQKADWPTHKLLCASFSTFTTPPSPSHRLGILLPQNSQTPRLTWVDCPLQPGQDGDQSWERAVLPELGFRIARSMNMRANALRKRWREDPLRVYYNDDFMIDGSGFNECVPAVTKGNALHPWGGSLLVMRVPGLGIDPGLCIDPGRYVSVQMVDFRDAVDLLAAYPVRNIQDMRGIARPVQGAQEPGVPASDRSENVYM